MTAPNVAFCRPLQPGMRGNDIVAHKRALARAMPHVYPWGSFSNYFGPVFEQACIAYKKAHALPHFNGKIGTTMHESLERARNHAKTGWAFDDTAIRLAHDFCHEFVKTPDQLARERVVDAALFWYAHRSAIAYSQARPFQLGKPPWVPSRWDCSGFVTACHYAGGAPDPNGRGYDHQGYTGTLLDGGTRVAHVTDLKPGDLIFYGSTTRPSPAFPVGSPTHVALYIGVIDGVHCVVSHGHYPMGLYPYDYRGVNQFRHYKVAA